MAAQPQENHERAGSKAEHPDLVPQALSYQRSRRKYLPLVLTAITFLIVVLVVFIFADRLAPFHYRTMDLSNRRLFQ